MKTVSIILLSMIFSFASCSFQQEVLSSEKKIVNKKKKKEKTEYLVFKNGIFVKDSTVIPPVIAGGNDAAYSRGYEKMKYPDMALDKHIMGKVLITLIIDEAGRIENTKLKEGIGYGCDEEALKTVKYIYEDLEKPAMLNGIPVKVKFDVPIYFKLTF